MATFDRATSIESTLRLSARSEVSAFIVMDVMRKANQLENAGRHVVHMEVGQPGTPAPRRALDAATAAMAKERLGYTDALGLSVLRERIAQHYADWYGLDIPAARIVVTTGSSAGFVLAFLAAFDPRARVALPSPGYPCYRHILTALGVEPITLEVGDDNRWMPDVELLSNACSTRRLDGLLLASPANPTGTVMTRERLQQLVGFCRERGIRFISDEIYHGLTYDAPAETALAFDDTAIVINSFSKYFSMTGWRIGWMVVPDEAARPIERLAQNLYISAPTISQYAGLAAFDATSELEAIKETYRTNRALLLDQLPKIGFDRIVPADGAFYLYVDVSELTGDSVAFADRILQESGVAMTPGLDFDPSRGRQFIRISYARSTGDIAEGIERLRRWISENA